MKVNQEALLSAPALWQLICVVRIQKYFFVVMVVINTCRGRVAHTITVKVKGDHKICNRKTKRKTEEERHTI